MTSTLIAASREARERLARELASLIAALKLR